MSESRQPNPEQAAADTAGQDMDTPFLIETLRRDVQPNGSFRPAASMRITPALRTSGFLQAVPAEVLRSLLLMLTFLTPNGNCIPTVQELSAAMRVPQMIVRSRMGRLERLRWLGAPVAIGHRRESGLHAFAPSPYIVGTRDEDPLCPHCGQDRSRSPLDPAIVDAARQDRRRRIIENSRQEHARPRADVERMIGRLMGWEPKDLDDEAVRSGDSAAGPAATDGTRRVRDSLLSYGLSRDQADWMLTRYDLERIERQVAWLPLRQARNPAAYLCAAIEGDYGEPLASRRHSDALPEAPGGEKPGDDHPPLTP